MQLCKSKIETVGEWGKTIANDRDVIVEVLVSSFCVTCGCCVAGKMNFLNLFLKDLRVNVNESHKWEFLRNVFLQERHALAKLLAP